MRNSLILGALMLLQAGAFPSFAQSVCDAVSGNLVSNCGFETGNFNNWTVAFATDGGSDITVTTTSAYLHSGTHAAEFAASGTVPDSISQTLATAAGHMYTLNFWLENRLSAPGQAGFWAYWDGSQIFSASSSAFGYTDYTFTVTGTGSDSLKFSGMQPPSAYALDDVEVLAQASAPETSSILLLGTILLVVATAIRRRRAA